MSDDLTQGANQAVVTPQEVAWDGVWDLDKDEEMRAMLKTLMQSHEAVLMRVWDDWQMGWKGKGFEVWGLRLPCPRRAIRDASERLFKKIKGKAVVNGDYAPNPLLHWVTPVKLGNVVSRLEGVVKEEAGEELVRMLEGLANESGLHPETMTLLKLAVEAQKTGAMPPLPVCMQPLPCP